MGTYYGKVRVEVIVYVSYHKIDVFFYGINSRIDVFIRIEVFSQGMIL